MDAPSTKQSLRIWTSCHPLSSNKTKQKKIEKIKPATIQSKTRSSISSCWKKHTLTHLHTFCWLVDFLATLSLSVYPFLLDLSPDRFCSRVHISDAAAQNFYEIDFSKQFKVRTHCTHGAKTTGRANNWNLLLLPPLLLSLSTFARCSNTFGGASGEGRSCSWQR